MKKTPRRIFLTQGYSTLVDWDDYEWLSHFRWSARRTRKRVYARRWGGDSRPTVHMHREILKAQDGLVVDHINGDTLDNRRCNLRLCTHSDNIANKPKNKSNRCGYKGVYQRKWGKYQASIRYQKKYTYLGMFDTAEEAAKAYNKAAKRIQGDFACLNNV